jgi:hypothetical protein
MLPKRGLICSVGPTSVFVTAGWPGAKFWPLFWHWKLTEAELAVRNAPVVTFANPAALPLHVSPELRDLLQLGSPMKCGLAAKAICGTNVTSSDAAVIAAKKRGSFIVYESPLQKEAIIVTKDPRPTMDDAADA